eukprot:21896-Rhodomonas_salina.1
MSGYPSRDSAPGQLQYYSTASLAVPRTVTLCTHAVTGSAGESLSLSPHWQARINTAGARPGKNHDRSFS